VPGITSLHSGSAASRIDLLVLWAEVCEVGQEGPRIQDSHVVPARDAKQVLVPGYHDPTVPVRSANELVV
jgi:hypothetical protein